MRCLHAHRPGCDPPQARKIVDDNSPGGITRINLGNDEFAIILNHSRPLFPHHSPTTPAILHSPALPFLHSTDHPSLALLTGCSCSCAERESGSGLRWEAAMDVKIYNSCSAFSYLCACPGIKIRTKSEISLCQFIKNFNCPFI